MRRLLWRFDSAVAAAQLLLYGEACCVEMDVAASVSWSLFEDDRMDPPQWSVDCLLAETIQGPQWRRFEQALEALDASIRPEHLVLADRDWVLITQQGYSPYRIGVMLLMGDQLAQQSRYVGPRRLWIPAGRAFGTGDHATTRGCLQALSDLARGRRFERMLDLGCGSGILAIAMARLWPFTVAASDHDRTAIAVARDNGRRNGVLPRLDLVCADGLEGLYGARARLRHQGCGFDLITANLHAGLVMKLLPSLMRGLLRGGILIVSGLLISQGRRFQLRARGYGLVFVRSYRDKGWVTLVLIKSG